LNKKKTASSQNSFRVVSGERRGGLGVQSPSEMNGWWISNVVILTYEPLWTFKKFYFFKTPPPFPKFFPASAPASSTKMLKNLRIFKKKIKNKMLDNWIITDDKKKIGWATNTLGDSPCVTDTRLLRRTYYTNLKYNSGINTHISL